MGSMRKFATALGLTIAGYAIGAFFGAVVTSLLSTNTHDKSVEAAMTAVFVAGPVGALLSLVGFLLASLFRRRGKG